MVQKGRPVREGNGPELFQFAIVVVIGPTTTLDGRPMRSNVAFTSSAVSAAPSPNRTPLRKKKVYVLRSFEILPAVGQIGNDGLAAVPRIASDQIVEHRRHRAQVVERARLMQVEMRRAVSDAHAQHTAVLRVRSRRREVELRAIEL